MIETAALMCACFAAGALVESWRNRAKAKSAGNSYVLINPKEPLEAQRPPGWSIHFPRKRRRRRTAGAAIFAPTRTPGFTSSPAW